MKPATLLNYIASLARRFNNSSLPVAIKWSVMIACFITLAMSALGWFLINQQKDFYQQQNQILGRTLVNQLSRAASEPLLADDDLALNILLEQQGKEKLLLGMQLFDKEGRLRAQTGMASSQDIQALLATDNKQQPGYLTDHQPGAMTFFSPIEFQGVTTGLALVTIDQHPLELQLAQLTNALLTTTLVLITLGILLALPLAYRLYAPIQQLVDAGNKLTAKHPRSTVHADRKDEIGRVLDSFHHLADGMLEKRKIENAFSQFVSPSIARQVLSHPAGSQLGGETIEGSVLFCDVVGFTEMSEDLQPAEVADLLNQYFKYFSIATESCNGTVDKFIGDCIMILFGVPEPDEQHAIHAVTCAVLIQKIAAQINLWRQIKGQPLVQFRIGINSGAMLAGNLGSEDRMQYTVVGDVVNLTSRICDLCNPGQILINRDTLEQPGVKHTVKHQSVGSVQVKGRKTPVYPYVIDIDHFVHKRDMDKDISRVLPKGALS